MFKRLPLMLMKKGSTRLTVLGKNLVSSSSKNDELIDFNKLKLMQLFKHTDRKVFRDIPKLSNQAQILRVKQYRLWRFINYFKFFHCVLIFLRLQHFSTNLPAIIRVRVKIQKIVRSYCLTGIYLSVTYALRKSSTSTLAFLL